MKGLISQFTANAIHRILRTVMIVAHLEIVRVPIVEAFLVLMHELRQLGVSYDTISKQFVFFHL
jgi:hypothetical protein